MEEDKGKLNPTVKLYIGAVITCALFFTGVSLINARWDTSMLFGFIVFSTLIVLSNLSPVKLPKVGTVTITYALNMASIFVYGPVVAIISELISSMIIVFTKLKDEKIKEIFNVSQLVICIFLASLLVEPWLGREIQFNSALLATAFLASFTYFVVNTLLVTLVISLHQNLNPLSVWLTNFKLLTPHYLILAPLGLGVASITYYLGVLGVILFFLPLLLARHSFKLYMDMREYYLNTIETLIKSIEAKDEYTKGHSDRVAAYSMAVGKSMGLDELTLEQLNYLALLHDIGKVAVSDTILNKNDNLSCDEYDLVKNHSTVGAEIIKDIKLLKDEQKVVLHHHERWDGGGYPSGIEKDSIPLLARIIAVADCFDAMTSDRAYRKGLSYEVAIEEIVYCSGSQFDPEVVEAFIECLPEILPDVDVSEVVESMKETTNLAY